ncbi:hypothetical protein BHE74_00002185 [Ensete ventricosum]|nr:hypothetical protein GW17_00006844 [Ensete ventricosum]RWW88916.1 hypothetical protein BHE74_00002185 [Ensete ventricosum]RZR76042.1 hypothetical protein BHM03_00000646 [Ensete ventricosum]
MAPTARRRTNSWHRHIIIGGVKRREGKTMDVSPYYLLRASGKRMRCQCCRCRRGCAWKSTRTGLFSPGKLASGGRAMLARSQNCVLYP